MSSSWLFKINKEGEGYEQRIFREAVYLCNLLIHLRNTGQDGRFKRLKRNGILQDTRTAIRTCGRGKQLNINGKKERTETDFLFSCNKNHLQEVREVIDLEYKEMEEKMNRKKNKKQTIFFPVCIILLVIGVIYISLLYYIDFQTRPVSKEMDYKIYEISSGRLSSVCDELQENGIIKSGTAFKIRSILSGVHGNFKKGTYELSPSMTTEELIAVLQTGGLKEDDTQVVTVMIPEGYSVEEIAQLLYEKGAIYDKEIFLDLCKTGEKFKDSIAVADITTDNDAKYALEGYLFPDTYEFIKNSSSEQAITKMLDRFTEIYSEEYIAKAKEYGLSKRDVITLASIIEKEGKTKDFSKISSVLHNRMDKNMYLQVDATIRYVNNLENSISITSEQYQSESPYNTYKHMGLPPSPICNPSENAIRAVFYPDEQFVEEGYLYFCLTDYKTGNMVYAKTYEEHLENVKKYKEDWKAYDEAIE